METINIGIFGHIDHGKTTLLQKLTGKWTDTHSEELKRGITIKLGYADTTIYKSPEGEYNITGKGKAIRHVSFIDAPGHEMLMATTLSGAALIDAALLVIAANEGIKPQTREHLMTLKAKKVEQLIVIQNKIDLVDKIHALKNYKEIQEFLKSDFPKVKVLPVSAQQNINISSVLEEITELKIPSRKLKESPVFLIARSFDINKPGTTPKNLKGAVLGGSLKQGLLRTGDKIEIKPGRKEKTEAGTVFHPIKTRVLALFNGSEKVEELTPGGSMSIETELEMSQGKNDSLGGNLLSHEGHLPSPETKIKIKHTLFPEVFGLAGHQKVEEIKKTEILMLSINTSITGGSVAEVTKDHISIDLKVPTVFFKGDNLGIARNLSGHWRLIGYGEIV